VRFSCAALNPALGEPYSSFNASVSVESLINILVDIFETPNDSLVMIDELEAGIHPNVQRRLCRYNSIHFLASQKTFCDYHSLTNFTSFIPSEI
jgi:predicted ATPase